MPNGTVKFFNAAKKFGFVTPDEGGKDVFVPVASMRAAGISALKAGQRVSFETTPDGKGPKVVNLVLVEGSQSSLPAAKLPKPISRDEERTQLTFYYDAACDKSRRALAELRATGFEPRVVDYVATPPGRDELKRLSMLLRDGDRSLVRRYDPLFHDLRLDDRFISHDEFWDGIVENPALINGPIVATANGACICRSENAMKQFLASVFPGRMQTSVEKKAVAERAVAQVTESSEVKLIAPEIKTKASQFASAETAAPKGGAMVQMKAKAAPRAKGKANAEPAAKKTAKKAVRNPAQKSRRVKAK